MKKHAQFCTLVSIVMVLVTLFLVAPKLMNVQDTNKELQGGTNSTAEVTQKYLPLEPTFSVGEIPESYFASASFLYTLLFTILIFAAESGYVNQCLKTLAKNETNNTERK